MGGSGCLKLTFKKEEEDVMLKLFYKLQHMQFVRSTLYSRHYGKYTMLYQQANQKPQIKKYYIKYYCCPIKIGNGEFWLISC